MAAETISRVHYYQRQFLGAEDFNAEQAYHRDMRRRHNLAQHTWGIVTGVELIQKDRQGDPSAKDIFITPGFAVDGFGREIVVLHTQALDPELFAAFTGNKTLTVWLTYADELGKRPAAGFEDCEALDQYGRVSESFGLLVEPKGDEHDPVIVDDKTAVPYDRTKTPPANSFVIPADGSAPHQEFPDDAARPSWRIKLGSVNWDGTARAFRDTPTDTLAEGRIYAGAVADKLLAPANSLRIGPRKVFADPAKEATFAAIEGPLRVDGDVTLKANTFVHGGMVSFQGANGAEDNVPLWVARKKNPTGPGVDLRVHIGDPFQPAQPAKLARLSVGPVESGKEKAVFAVRNDNTAEIPTGSLEFRDAKRQFVNVEQGQYGMGYQSAALYFRTDGDFYWFRGGEHDDGNGAAGTGGVAMMRLDAGGKLHALGAAEVHGNFLVDGTTRLKGEVRTDTHVIVAPNGDAILRTRHVHGKDSGADFTGPLFLNWNTGHKVVVGRGGGPESDLEVNGNLSVDGGLNVTGGQNLFKVRTQTFALTNGGVDAPRGWTFSHVGEFSQIYTAFAVLQGYSLWNNENNIAFLPNPANHVANADSIVQHVFVRVTSSNANFTSGELYCSESKASLEGDNTVLFTVVVMGRP
jgi:hypothetical protein